PILKGVLPGWATMKANTAIGLVLSALVLTLRPHREQRWRYSAAGVCAAVVAVLGALTLTEYVVGWDLGIDNWPFRESAEAAATGQPGRMAPMTALAFVLLGLAELMLEDPVGVAVSQWFGVAVGFVGLLNLVGYVYRLQGLSGLYSPPTAY